MLLVVDRLDGYRQEFPLDLSLAGVGVQLTDDCVEWLPLEKLTALELEADDENPGLRASMGQYMKIIPLDPSSRILVGWEDPRAAPPQRSASIVVSEIARLSLDFDRPMPSAA